MNSPASHQWQFSASEVEILSPEAGGGVLGRGAYGEVSIARWRGIKVAAKQLHALTGVGGGEGGAPVMMLSSEEMEGVRKELMKEMEVLSRLRHPNLLLFLGVALEDDPAYGGRALRSLQYPRFIITELMPHSVYDVLEKMKLRLSVAEVLAIAAGVAKGLAYLHCNEPPIIHRDISSKNVLLDGHRVVIADLGQAKVLDKHANSRSRQTGMPGAMAYSAPEVLTGRYTAKIDIFSFAVLLVQLLTGEYPRIEARQEQVERAGEAAPLLQMLVGRCLALDANERPAATDLARELDQLLLAAAGREEGGVATTAAAAAGERAAATSNIVMPPVGPVAQHWVRDRLSRFQHARDRAEDAERQLASTQKLLSAEEGRWQKEADARDRAEGETKDVQQRLEVAQRAFQQLREELARAEEARAAAEAAIADTERHAEALAEALEKVRGQLAESEESAAADCRRADNAIRAKEGAEEREQKARDAMESAVADRAAAEATMKDARDSELNQVEKTEESDARLDQAISRWEKEKCLRLEMKLWCQKANGRQVAAEEAMKAMAAKLDAAEDRVREYDDLPMPDQIRMRIKDSEEVADAARTERDAALERATEAEAARDAADASVSTAEQARQAAEVDCERALQQADDAVHDLQVAQGAAAEADLRVQLHTKKLEDGIRREDALKEALASAEGQIDEMRSQAPWLFSGKKSSKSKDPAVRAAAKAAAAKAAAEGGPAFIGSPATVTAGAATTAPATPVIAAAVGGGGGGGGGGGADAKAIIATAMSVTPDDLSVSSEMVAAGVTVPSVLSMRSRAVVGAMAQHAQNASVQWRGAKALRDLLSKGEQQQAGDAKGGGDTGDSEEACRAEIMASGAASVCVVAMRQHEDHPNVQHYCLRLIASLAFNNDANRAALGALGALEAVVGAMQRPSMQLDANLQGQACTAITNLTHNNDDNREKLLRSDGGGVKSVLDAMERFPGDARLQRQACWAILTLASNNAISRSIASEGGLGAVLAAMINCRHDASVQHFGCWAVANIAWDGEDIQRFAKQEGALEVCRAACNTFPDHRGVQEKATLVIARLSSS